MLVDVLGLCWSRSCTAASVQDYDGARRVMEPLRHRFSRLRLIWADSIYKRRGCPSGCESCARAASCAWKS